MRMRKIKEDRRVQNANRNEKEREKERTRTEEIERTASSWLTLVFLIFLLRRSIWSLECCRFFWSSSCCWSTSFRRRSVFLAFFEFSELRLVSLSRSTSNSRTWLKKANERGYSKQSRRGYATVPANRMETETTSRLSSPSFIPSISHSILTMISATVVETSVTSNDNCPSQDFSQTDDLTTIKCYSWINPLTPRPNF